MQRGLAIVRPTYREQLEAFESGPLTAVLHAIKVGDPEQFAQAFAAASELANQMHVRTGHGYIRWVLPSEPPPGLDLGPVPSGRVHRVV